MLKWDYKWLIRVVKILTLILILMYEALKSNVEANIREQKIDVGVVDAIYSVISPLSKLNICFKTDDLACFYNFKW